MEEEIDTNANFEDSLDELEEIVDKLEHGQLTLEESIAIFERGMKLAYQCNQQLVESEQKIEQLVEENGRLRQEPFHSIK
ncbi:MAG: exodeoxyribonuclease VII small subunit [Euryarchaeota archaeon]|nr:exodeoxyribonuclease VII small subunit [Euryarchaeota archaeon]